MTDDSLEIKGGMCKKMPEMTLELIFFSKKLNRYIYIINIYILIIIHIYSIFIHNIHIKI